MALSKLEIQQMLREMNVKFDAHETYEQLKHRLQQEHHSLWLKSGSQNRPGSSNVPRTVVRKRRKKIPPEAESIDSPMHTAHKTAAEKSTRPGISGNGRQPVPPRRMRPIEKPAPGKPWKPAGDGTQPFTRTKNVFKSVLKRAKNRCERCGKETGEGPQAVELHPYYIQPIAEGGEHSIKNMVGLCPSCLEAMEKDPSSKDIKALKRKTRSRLYDSLQVVRKKR